VSCVTELAHIFKETPENITVQEGEVVRLSCLIDSVPFPPNITWQQNETLLSYNESKYSVVPPGVLYISATKLSDAGSYRYNMIFFSYQFFYCKLNENCYIPDA